MASAGKVAWFHRRVTSMWAIASRYDLPRKSSWWRRPGTCLRRGAVSLAYHRRRCGNVNDASGTDARRYRHHRSAGCDTSTRPTRPSKTAAVERLADVRSTPGDVSSQRRRSRRRSCPERPPYGYLRPGREWEARGVLSGRRSCGGGRTGV